MVGSIDIHSLNLEELYGVVGLYPWYGAARKELCIRMKEMGALSDALLSEAALHIGSRRILYNLAHDSRIQADSTLKTELAKARNAETESRQAPREKTIFIAGGDYFSQQQYNGVRRSDDNIFSSFASGSGTSSYFESESDSIDDLCTETLAQVYIEQGYFAEAKEIYSKLSLRYPEKSVYFATLIKKIEK